MERMQKPRIGIIQKTSLKLLRKQKVKDVATSARIRPMAKAGLRPWDAVNRLKALIPRKAPACSRTDVMQTQNWTFTSLTEGERQAFSKLTLKTTRTTQ